MFGLGDDSIVAIVAMLAIFGPAFYFIYMVGKLIKYRIDRKYSSSSSGELQEMREFRQRTERRLRALEEIIAEEDEEESLHEPVQRRKTGSRARKKNPKAEPVTGESEVGAGEEDEHEQDSEQSGRLKNQLKS
jgi:hypothetical protein